MILQPVADLVFAVGGLQCGQFDVLGLGHLLGDLVLNAAPERRSASGVNLAVGQHRELVPHVADALAQVGHRACGGRGRIVELVGQARGDGAERQQLLALPDDLGLSASADEVTLEQMDGHGELRIHEIGELVGVQHEAA